MSTIDSKSNKKRHFWRSPEELSSTPEFEEFLHREFPQAASEFPEGISRRRWLQLMGASLALGGMVGCRFENEKIAPFAMRPQNRVPGTTKDFATSIEWAGQVRPIVVSSYDGRPIHVRGNSLHPLSGGATDPFTQACTLALYDPDRSRHCYEYSEDGSTETSWEKFFEAAELMFKDADSSSGKGLAVIADPSSSPSLYALRDKLAKKYPGSKWVDFSSVNSDNQKAGLRTAFGKSVLPQYSLEKAKVILCLDADPLGVHSTSVKNSAQWAQSRNVEHLLDHDSEDGFMSRLYCVESGYSVTGLSADHRWAVRSQDIAGLLGSVGAHIMGTASDDGSSVLDDRASIVAQDLMDAKGACLIMVGDQQPAEVHAFAAKLNEKLGAVGNTLDYIESHDPQEKSGAEMLGELVADMKSKSIKSLVIVGANPAYDAPSDFGFVEALASVDKKAYLGLYQNETSMLCDWHLCMSHPLEAWGDAIAIDGSYCVSQPLIDPLFDSKSPIEVFANLLGEELTSGKQIVQKASAGKGNWRKMVHDGFVVDSQGKPVDVKVSADVVDIFDEKWKTPDRSQFEVVFRPSYSVFDGRLGNSGWLQETPSPLSKLTWDNAAMMCPATAEGLRVTQSSKIKITTSSGEVTLPVYIQPGAAKGSINVEVGYGRREAGVVGGSEAREIPTVGTDVSPIRGTSNWWIASSASVEPVRGSYTLATTQDHFSLDLTGLSEIEKRWDQLIKEGVYDHELADGEQESKMGLVQFVKKFHDQLHGHGSDAHDEENHDKSHPEGASADEKSHDEKSHDEKSHDEKSHDEKSHDEGAHEGDDHGHHLGWPLEVHHHPTTPEDLSETPSYSETNRWGMGIDLNKCTGCNNCIVACQSENNIPVVGKDQVSKGREMHWLRLDRYLISDLEGAVSNPLKDPEPQVISQPLTCQHCEKAPCEQVCPVAATIHSSEGLNDMVYNRCIGTRYCGNNCPFKVRRFNFLNYSDAQTFIKYPDADKVSKEDMQLQSMIINPEVTVRSRGVMEKCTFCVQRIQNTKITARNEDREIEANEVQTACQQACPTSAITFGDLSNEKSDVAKAHKDVRAYTMLEYLNVSQRTKYLARVRNPHPEWPRLEVEA